MKEEWKDIEGDENYYIISNTGKIKSLLTNKVWFNSKQREEPYQVLTSH